MVFRQITADIHVHERAQGFFGLPVGARMTILSLDGGLLLHSPTDADPDELQALGTPRWLLAPSKMHHLYAGPWMQRGVEGWAAPGLPEKRSDLSFANVVTDECEPFGDQVLLIPMRCFSLTNEVVLLHRPSRTLVVTDLVFNFSKSAPWITRAGMTCAGGYPGCSTTVLERVGMNRATARTEVSRLLELDFDRLIPSHGEIIETGGKEALRKAFGWLKL